MEFSSILRSFRSDVENMTLV